MFLSSIFYILKWELIIPSKWVEGYPAKGVEEHQRGVVP